MLRGWLRFECLCTIARRILVLTRFLLVVARSRANLIASCAAAGRNHPRPRPWADNISLALLLADNVRIFWTTSQPACLLDPPEKGRQKVSVRQVKSALGQVHGSVHVYRSSRQIVHRRRTTVHFPCANLLRGCLHRHAEAPSREATALAALTR